MKVNPTQSYITCEFESVDLAELSIGRLVKGTGGIRSVTMRRRQQRPQQQYSVIPAVVPAIDNSAVYPMAADPYGMFAVLKDPDRVLEPELTRSVTAEFRCNRKNARSIAAQLTSLGATHIRIH